MQLIYEQGVPGGKTLFTGFGVLLKVRASSTLIVMLTAPQAAKGVSAMYDTLEVLGKRVEAFLDRLQEHLAADNTLREAFRKILIQALVEVLRFLGLLTREFRKPSNAVKTLVKRLGEWGLSA